MAFDQGYGDKWYRAAPHRDFVVCFMGFRVSRSVEGTLYFGRFRPKKTAVTITICTVGQTKQPATWSAMFLVDGKKCLRPKEFYDAHAAFMHVCFYSCYCAPTVDYSALLMFQSKCLGCKIIPGTGIRVLWCCLKQAVSSLF